MVLEPTTISSSSKILPVFPLPDTVFFSGTCLPIHVFEPRYRALVRDVVAGDGMIVVSLETKNGFHDLGMVGQIKDLVPLEDGGFELLLTGLERSSLTKIRAGLPYRKARVEPRPEQPGTNDPARIAEARLEILASYGMLLSILRGNAPLVSLQDLSFELLVNTVCARLPIEASLRQRLLQEDTLIERQRLGLEFLTAAIETVRWLRAMKGSTATNPVQLC